MIYMCKGGVRDIHVCMWCVQLSYRCMCCIKVACKGVVHMYNDVQVVYRDVIQVYCGIQVLCKVSYRCMCFKHVVCKRGLQAYVCYTSIG